MQYIDLHMTSFKMVFLRNLWNSWQRLWIIFHMYRQLDDLQRLIGWAHHKRLTKVRDYYRSRVEQVNVALIRYQCRFPTMLVWVRRMYLLHKLLAPKPRYYRKGSAATYRSRFRSQTGAYA
jgi:hypothetical protein